MGSIPGQESRIPHVARDSHKKKKEIQKENQIAQVKKFSAFLSTGRRKSLDSMKLFLSYAPQLSRGQYPGFPGGAVVDNPPANAGDATDVGLMPGSGRSLEEGMAIPPVFLL